MEIAFVSSEMYPFSKTGGLADVAAALPSALQKLEQSVTVFTPLYPDARAWLEHYEQQTEPHRLLEFLWISDHQRQVSFRVIEHHGVKVVFIENDWAFDRPGLYLNSEGQDHPDNVGRFALFSRAVLEYCQQTGFKPDIFHCNDWQSSLLPVYLKTSYQRSHFEKARTVLTIHNLGYQGIFPASEIYSAGLGWELFNATQLEYHGQLNLLKGGIVFADAVTTVSPTYARQIQSAEVGMGLQGLIRHHKRKLTGILNGIDEQIWNPATDKAIAVNYSRKKLSGKAACKRELQSQLGLEKRGDAFLIGMVTRFDHQKGVELALGAFPSLANKCNVQLVLLGSGAKELEQRALELAQQHPGRVSVSLKFDEALAHQIYAGADALLMPSRYEPCGLNQMYAQRYGTVPIVRETGGLKDTVRNYSPAKLKKGQASGFTFRLFQQASLELAIRKAYTLFSKGRADWKNLVKDIMALDNSWQRSAKAYVKLYKKLAKPERKAKGKAKSRSSGAQS